MKYRVQVEYAIDLDIEAESFADAVNMVEQAGGVAFKFSKYIDDAGKHLNANCIDWSTSAVIKL